MLRGALRATFVVTSASAFAASSGRVFTRSSFPTRLMSNTGLDMLGMVRWAVVGDALNEKVGTFFIALSVAQPECFKLTCSTSLVYFLVYFLGLETSLSHRCAPSGRGQGSVHREPARKGGTLLHVPEGLPAAHRCCRPCYQVRSCGNHTRTEGVTVSTFGWCQARNFSSRTRA